MTLVTLVSTCLGKFIPCFCLQMKTKANLRKQTVFTSEKRSWNSFSIYICCYYSSVLDLLIHGNNSLDDLDISWNIQCLFHIHETHKQQITIAIVSYVFLCTMKICFLFSAIQWNDGDGFNDWILSDIFCVSDCTMLTKCKNDKKRMVLLLTVSIKQLINMKSSYSTRKMCYGNVLLVLAYQWPQNNGNIKMNIKQQNKIISFLSVVQANCSQFYY